jgi:hypothetical protein
MYIHWLDRLILKHAAWRKRRAKARLLRKRVVMPRPDPKTVVPNARIPL